MRYDLMSASRAAVKRVFLVDNGARRQQTRMDQARFAITLYEAELEEAGKRPSGDVLGREEPRKRVGEIISVSDKTLLGYLNVLRAPAEVQLAFEQGRIKLVDATRVAGLSKPAQHRIATRLRAGDHPRP